MRTLICVVVWVPLLLAQTGTPPLTFEVASIKATPSNAGGTSIQLQPGGGLNVTNATLRMLITTAFDVRNFQVSGGPAWIESDRFDVIAKAEQPLTAAAAPDLQRMSYREAMSYGGQMRERLRSLLADRFQLAVHREEKEAPAYALVVAKSGAKLKLAPEAREGGQGIRMNKGLLIATGVPMEMLATSLSNQVGRPVLDKTELLGSFDFKLEWTPEQEAGPSSPELTGPSLFSAIQEQLVLRLESRRTLVQTIVIDRVEKPSAN